MAVANEVADRHFDFFFKHYDRAKGDAVPEPHTVQPDGFVTWHEFPKTDDELQDDEYDLPWKPLDGQIIDSNHALSENIQINHNEIKRIKKKSN